MELVKYKRDRKTPLTILLDEIATCSIIFLFSAIFLALVSCRILIFMNYVVCNQMDVNAVKGSRAARGLYKSIPRFKHLQLRK